MSPEEKARFVIDEKLIQSGWIIQDVKPHGTLGMLTPNEAEILYREQNQ